MSFRENFSFNFKKKKFKKSICKITENFECYQNKLKATLTHELAP